MVISYLKKTSGFTLIELLIVLAIIGIISLVGVPNYNTFLEKSRFEKATNNLYNAYRFARSEAIKTSSPMTLKPKEVNDWSDGWKVVDSTDRVLLTVKAPHSTVNISGNAITVFGRGSINMDGLTMLKVFTAQRIMNICILESGQSKKEGCV